MTSRPLLAYFGHHKCATRWIIDILADIGRSARLRCHEVHNVRDMPEGLARSIEDLGIELLCYSNAAARHVRTLLDLRAFHVIRDPRDIIVSAYFSHLHSHTTGTWLAQHRRKLQTMSKEEGLLEEIRFSEGIFIPMDKWDYGRSDILELRMEELTARPQELFERILAFLGLFSPQGPIDSTTLATILRRHSFVVKSGGRKPGDTCDSSHYRNGVAGDWRNHLKEEHLRLFEKRHPGLLLKLGYERRPSHSTSAKSVNALEM